MVEILSVREAKQEDLRDILTLYTFLHESPYPDINPQIEALWAKIIGDENQQIILGYSGDKLVSSCVLVIVPNLTHGQRPYALVENVITHPQHRGQGHATRVLAAARKVAKARDCYKIMLMTGAKEAATLDFYRCAGYNSNDKTAFVQWL